MNPFKNLPLPAQTVLQHAFLTLIHSLGAVALAEGAGVPLRSQSGVIVAGLGGAISILWHGLPALVGSVRAKRLNAKLTAVAALEAQIRASIAANPVAPPAPPVP